MEILRCRRQSKQRSHSFGMPNKPITNKSSFGCRVICPYGASYGVNKEIQTGNPCYKEKAQYDEFQKITIRAGQAGIPKLFIDDAQRYHKISGTRTFRGLNRDGIIAASIYISSRINQFLERQK